jgi:hypothetical protein
VLKTLVATLPIAAVLALGPLDAAASVNLVQPVRDAIGEVAECANLRMMDATAVADGTGPPLVQRDEPWRLQLHGRSVAGLQPAQITYCGRSVAGTVVTLSDGTTTTLPGRARLVAVSDGAAEFATN